MKELLVIEPIIAYRVWLVKIELPTSISAYDNDMSSATFFLSSSGRFSDFRWRRGKHLATCKLDKCPQKDVPSFGCECGFYGHKGKLNIVAAAEQVRFVIDITKRASRQIGVIAQNIIIGEVELTGKVIEHEYGYRSQFAEIKKLVWIYKGNSCPLEQFIRTEHRYGLSWDTREHLPSFPSSDLNVSMHVIINSLYKKYKVPIIRYQEFLTDNNIT